MLAMSMKFFTTASARLPIFAAFMTSDKRFPRAAVSFILLAAALFSFSCSSFADFCADTSFSVVPNASSGLDLAAGAALDGALSALAVKLGISGGASLVTLDLIQSLISGNPVGTLPDYTYNQPLSEILRQETIKIRKDFVIIDGVEYSDVWLPHDAANKFRVNAFDFITHYNILSESNGTYVSGVGSCAGVPIYDVNGTLRSAEYLAYPPSSVGDIVVSASPNGSYYSFTHFSCNGGTVRANSSYVNGTPTHVIVTISSNSGFLRYAGQESTTSSFITWRSTYALSLPYTSSPFDFTWTSSVIPAVPLPSNQGLRFRVPSSYVSSFPAVVSPDLADYVTLINDLSNALEQARLADAVESTAFEEYDAPAPPVPSTGTIAEEPYTSLDGSLNGIQDSLDNIDTNIGTVDESLDDIQVYAEDAAESLQSIDTNLSQSVADTAGIKGFIQQYLPGVHSFLNSISTSVSNIAGSVAVADETFFGNVVDAIVAPFTPVFNIFKAGVGIWRYVVAWVGDISAPFSWIWSILSQANGILVSPILASAAAAVVLAVYKRFGR